MATIPRYQNMGVQYADLPRLSTAGMEQTAKLYDVLSEKLDRMSAYYQERAVTEAQRAGARYAIQNPVTKEQLDTALGTPEGVKVKGAGRVFQETYDKVQAKQLGSELQLEGQRKIGIFSERIKAGEELPLDAVQAEIRDMIDGYSASVMALDPEEALRLKASLATTGNKLFQDAAAKAYEKQKVVQEALYSSALSDTRPILESTIGSSGAIDPSTRKPVDITLQIENLRRPFLESVRALGKTDYLDKFDKLVRDAMVGAVTAKLTDRKQYTTLSEAIKSINAGDIGNLTGIYERLDQDEKNKVRTSIVAAFSAEYTANEQVKKDKAEKDKTEWSELSIEFLNPETSVARKREIIDRGLALQQITVTTGNSLLNPPPEKETKNPFLFINLNDQIARGLIASIEDLMPYQTSLSGQEFKQLGMAVTSTQGHEALNMLKTRSGVRDNIFVPQDKLAALEGMKKIYDQQSRIKIVDQVTGVSRLQTPIEAAEKAMDLYSSNKDVQENNNLKKINLEKITARLNERGISYDPERLYTMDVKSVKGLTASDRDDISNWLKNYKKAVDALGGVK